jgi:hypothetical protein
MGVVCRMGYVEMRDVSDRWSREGSVEFKA